MAGLDSFLKGFFGTLHQQRQMDREDEQWERRQRLLNDLDVDKADRIGKLKKEDGHTFQDENGQWVTQELDGHGNPIGTRPARPAEIAAVENATLTRDKNKFGVEHMEEDWEFERANKQGYLDVARGNLALGQAGLALRRQELAARAEGAGANTAPIGDVVDSYLNSSEGKAVLEAYEETMAEVANNPNIGGGIVDRYLRDDSTSEASDKFAIMRMLKEDIMQSLRALPPEERPQNDYALKQYIGEMAQRALQGQEGNLAPTPPSRNLDGYRPR